MRRYWLNAESVNGELVDITGDELHHIRDVCRMGLGAKFEVIIDGGQALLVEIIEEQKKVSIARIIETRTIPPLPEPHIHLAVSIPRLPVFEAVLEKAVELGAHSIHPFFSDFSFIRKQEDVLKKKQERWHKIVQSATQQSGRGELMSISEALPLESLLKSFNQSGSSVGLFAYEGEGQLAASRAIEQIRAHNPRQVWLFVGSEGGFSDKEVQLFQSFGLPPVTLGQQVLRVETACVALLSVIKYGFDQMK